jgi:uncharacterized glyoxalase superfamily protein PhnB
MKMFNICHEKKNREIQFQINNNNGSIIIISMKILKYTDLSVEVQCMWNVKTKVIPVIIGATQTISVIQKVLDQHMQKAQNQGATVNSHCTHTSYSTDVKVKNVQHGNNITCIISCNYRMDIP